MELNNGTLEKVLPTDWKLEDYLYTEKAKRRHDGPRAVYNQLNLSPYACFYAASFAASADCWELDSFEKSRALKAAKDGWAKVIADGKFTEGVGGYLSDGVDYARRAWNSAFPNKQVSSFRTANGSNEFYRALILNYAPVIGYFASKAVQDDILDDGTVQGDVKDAKSYGHLVRVAPRFQIIDNYPTRGRLAEAGRNTYYFDDWDKKLANGLLFKSSYVFMPRI